jgi:hypothetical protein
MRSWIRSMTGPIAVALLWGCAYPGTRADDMSAAEHRRAAGRYHELAEAIFGPPGPDEPAVNRKNAGVMSLHFELVAREHEQAAAELERRSRH